MAFQGDSIYWVELEKVVPNPFQPRREFDQKKLEELSESIRMYGVLQPLTVTRNEVQRDDGTFYTEYELIAGERRLRASKLAGVAQVPVIIREGEQSEQEKLELAIIENLQREDLNAVDRALAFRQLAESFGLSHAQVAQKVGRSREYVSNSIRLLGLPDHILEALKHGELMEGHARTLLMLTDRPEEQEVIFREVVLKKLSVREVERIVRKIATDKVRKKNATDLDVSLIELEKQFTETLGTRVQIQKTDFGGKLTIDYFSEDDLSIILKRMKEEAVDSVDQNQQASEQITESTGLDVEPDQHQTGMNVAAQESLVAEAEPLPPVVEVEQKFASYQPERELVETPDNVVTKEYQPAPRPSVPADLPPRAEQPEPERFAQEAWRPNPVVPEVQAAEPVPQTVVQENSVPIQPEAEAVLSPREEVEEVAEVANEFRNFISEHQNQHSESIGENRVGNHSEPAPVEESKVKDDEDDSSLYSIRNFNV